MALNVVPGDIIRVSFTLTNTGSPVSGVDGDEFIMLPSFMNVAQTDSISGSPILNILSGAMATNESRVFSLDFPIPSVTPGDYNLWTSVWDPNSVMIFNEIVLPSAVTVGGVYSVAVSNISVIKV